jgi:hypothetical protein
MSTDITDVNTDSAPSTESATASVGAEQQDANTNATDSSTNATATQETEKTLEQVVQDAFKESSASEDGETKQPETETEKPTDEKEQSVDQPPKEEEKGPIPYERFKEVNEAKTNYEKQINEFKPLAEAQRSIFDYCQKNNIAPDDFNYWLEVAALVKNDPAKALEVLQPQLDQLQSFKGDKLSPDLMAAVENGEISLQYAKRIAAAENQQKFTAERSKQTAQQRQQELANKYQTEMTNSLVSWAESKGSKVPDFKPKVAPNAKDGMYELFINKLTVELPRADIKDEKSLIAFAEKTFESVLETVGGFTTKPKAAGQTVLRTSQTNGSPKGEPKTLDDAIKRAAQQHGLVV